MSHSDRRADPGSRAVWLLVAAVVLGVADWAVTWLLIVQTDEGTREVAGLSEGALRASQNPGTLLMPRLSRFDLDGARRNVGLI